MNVTIRPRPLCGELNAPPSKSYMHRILICAALSDKCTEIMCTELSEDTRATLEALSSLGAEFEIKEKSIFVTPVGKCPNKISEIECKESGSTFRFMLPVAASLGINTLFYGSQRLGERPILPLCECLERGGVVFKKGKGTLPCEIEGKMDSGVYEITGDVSSQFVSGLMLALGNIGGGEIKVTGKTKSAPYIKITAEVMKSFGADVIKTDYGYKIKSDGYKTSGEAFVEGDLSNAAFHLAIGALGGKIKLFGLKEDTSQGDGKIVDILKEMGADIIREKDAVTVKKSQLSGINLDCEDIPDIVPVLCVIASGAKGESVFYNIKRLREKESDRVESTCALIKALGGNITADENSIKVVGTGKLSGGTIDSFNDHRICMSAAVASVICEENVTIMGAEAVNKSYPDFFEKFALLGGKII